jgi:plasmid maintenance system antidote protein VapI
MYRIKKKIEFKESHYKIAEKLGIAPESLSRILNGKANTKKLTAYCLVKMADSTAEIEDYFEKVLQK